MITVRMLKTAGSLIALVSLAVLFVALYLALTPMLSPALALTIIGVLIGAVAMTLVAVAQSMNGRSKGGETDARGDH